MFAVTDPTAESLYTGEEIERSDAQNWMTIKAFRYTFFGFGKLSKKQAKLLDKVEAGAQGAHKIQRGYLPYETYSAHYLLNNDLHNAIKKYVSEEKKVVNQEINFIKEKLSPYKKQP